MDERAPYIFINFRGRDQAGYAALLDRALSEAFGRDAVFLSSRSIRPGEDFVTALLRNVHGSTVLLAVIGPDWIRYGRLSPDDPDEESRDWVRREIAEALAMGVRVIPILVEDARLPRESQLPKEIAALSRCQYLRLHHRNIDHDLARVREELAGLIPMQRLDADPAAEAARAEVRWFALAPPQRSPCRVGLVAGDILRVHTADIWVNTENTDMEMSRINEFTISGTIRYWGAGRDESGGVVADHIARELAERVGGRRPVAPATVFVTGPGALADSHGVRHIIHVAAVRGEPGAGFRQVRDIGSCVTAVLTRADHLAGADPQVRAILLPLLGVGMGGARVRPTVVTMANAIADYLAANPGTGLREILLLGYSGREYATILESLPATGRFTPD